MDGNSQTRGRTSEDNSATKDTEPEWMRQFGFSARSRASSLSTTPQQTSTSTTHVLPGHTSSVQGLQIMAVAGPSTQESPSITSVEELMAFLSDQQTAAVTAREDERKQVQEALLACQEEIQALKDEVAELRARVNATEKQQKGRGVQRPNRSKSGGNYTADDAEDNETEEHNAKKRRFK